LIWCLLGCLFGPPNLVWPILSSRCARCRAGSSAASVVEWPGRGLGGLGMLRSSQEPWMVLGPGSSLLHKSLIISGWFGHRSHFRKLQGINRVDDGSPSHFWLVNPYQLAIKGYHEIRGQIMSSQLIELAIPHSPFSGSMFGRSSIFSEHLNWVKQRFISRESGIHIDSPQVDTIRTCLQGGAPYFAKSVDK